VPDPECRPHGCFECVRRKVERAGGRIQFGWSIWEWPGVMLQAEHHAVYAPAGAGSCEDITPSSESGVKRRLFLPDDAATHDFDHATTRDCPRFALVADPLIQEFFSAASALATLHNQLMAENPGVKDLPAGSPAAQQLLTVRERMQSLLRRLKLKHTPQGSPCFCGSGKKFKRCCGEPARRHP